MEDTVSKSISNTELNGIVHDLKTPITSIIGFIELLKQGNYSEKSKMEFYDIILSESHKLLNLVNDLLYFNKKNMLKINSSCNLSIEINKYIAELAPLAGKRNIEISINAFSNDIYVSIPEDKISRILTNIIENAIKYNKDYGKIFIDVAENKEQVFVKIRDTGVGIPQNEIDRIFNKYYRTTITENMNIEGSGLGLAIANDIVNEYHGQIKVNSKVGEYTEFIVSFPKSYIKN